MKSKGRKSAQSTLSDKIADALTVKPRADIEDDQVFGTKPQTVSRADLSSSDSEVDATISDFRKRNVNLLSEISKKYDGQVVSRKEFEKDELESDYEKSDSNDDHNLLTVEDLLLNEDSGSSHAEDTISKQSPSKSELKSKVFGKNSTSNDATINLNGSVRKYSKSPSKSSKKLPENEKSDGKINKILQSIGGFSPKQAKVSETNSDSDNSLSDKSEDHIISKLHKKVNQAIIALKKAKEHNLSDSGEQSSEDSETDDYSINQKQESESDENNVSESGEEDEGYDISQMDAPVQEEFEHVKKQNISEEAKKGACVRNQLLIWEGLLEMRIHLQRCMNTANQMPLPDTFETLKNDSGFSEECNMTKSNVTAVLDKFLTLQNLLLKNNPETKSLCDSKKQIEESKDTSKNDDDEEIPSDTDEEIPSDTDAEDDDPKHDKQPVTSDKKTVTRKRKLQDYETELSKSHKSFKTFRDATIQKWNDKTRLATATNIKNAPTNTILQQISYILSDREKLVRRTQLKRSEYEIIGYQPTKKENEEENPEVPINKDRKDADEYIPEIFDDSDFYHQLLRELIECKSADISDPVQLSRQWIALQQMRSKMKRKVDTKATKGRKIKYVVHNKLVNYMAPEKFTSWTDESTNELYNSLFGKMFENNNVGLNANLDNGFKIKN